MLRQDNAKHTEMAYERQLALIGCSVLDGPQYKKIFEDEANLYDQRISALYGGIEKKEDRKSKVASIMREAWEREFGKLDSPEVQKNIRDTALGLRTNRQATQPRKLRNGAAGNTLQRDV